MAVARAAIRYAKAVLGFAQDQKSAEKVLNDMALIVNTLANNEELQTMLKSPIIKSKIKRDSLKEIFSGINPASEGLINILTDNKRVDILGDVAQKYMSLFDQLKGRETAIVTTVVPLSGELEKKVLLKVKELTSSNDITIDNKIDESIIGGFILRVGDLQYNASISNKLSNLKREFIN